VDANDGVPTANRAGSEAIHNSPDAPAHAPEASESVAEADVFSPVEGWGAGSCVRGAIIRGRGVVVCWRGDLIRWCGAIGSIRGGVVRRCGGITCIRADEMRSSGALKSIRGDGRCRILGSRLKKSLRMTILLLEPSPSSMNATTKQSSESRNPQGEARRGKFFFSAAQRRR
jgi:hypothetical protein